MNDKLLYTTKELFDSYLHGKTYSIPPYQRGYKWDTKDIDRLLKDINDFCPNEELDLFYCLQNNTLVENADSFNVVDGQQRLTTLTVISEYISNIRKMYNNLEIIEMEGDEQEEDEEPDASGYADGTSFLKY